MSLVRRPQPQPPAGLGGGGERLPLLTVPPGPPGAILFDGRPEQIAQATRERLSYLVRWIYGMALVMALMAAGVSVSIYLAVYAMNASPPVLTTTTTTTTPPPTQPPFTCSDTETCPLNCSAVSVCLPPPQSLVCNDVQGCIDGANLTLGHVTVQTLTAQNVTQVDISYQSVFQAQDVILNGSLACVGGMTIGDDCVPLRIKTINVISPHPTTKNFVIGGGPGIGVSGTPNGLDIFNTGVLHVGLDAPVEEFNVTVALVSSSGTLTFVKTVQLPNTVWAGASSNVNGSQVPEFRSLVEADIPLLSLASKVYDVLAVAHGGTGTGVPLAGGRIMVSAPSPSQSIVEGPALSALGDLLVGDGTGGVISGHIVGGYDANVTAYPNGTIVVTVAQSVHSVSLVVPTDIFSVTSGTITDTGTLSFSVIPQSGNTFWASPVNGETGAPGFRIIAEADLPQLSLQTKVYGVLPVANGGTNNAGPLSGNRLLVSASNGLSIVEASALTNGRIFIGQTGGAPVAATPTGAGGITIGTGPGTMSVTMTSTPSFSTLNVAGTTTLGTSTTCAAPLANGCVEISSKTCPLGPLGSNCWQTSGLHLTDLTVDVLNILNFTTQSTVQVINNTNLATDNLYVHDIFIVNNGTIMCEGTGYVDQDCIEISNLGCPLGPLQGSCTPTNLTASNIQSTGTATFNNVVCSGSALPDNCVTIDDKTCSSPVNDTCVSLHVKTVNGVAPDVVTRDLSLNAGTGIGIAGTTVTNTVASTPQAGNLFYASPNGTSGLPGFRSIGVSDLPLLGADQVFFDSVGPANLTQLVAARAVTSVDVTVPAALLSVSGTPVGPGLGGGTIALTLQSQGPNTVFASPTNATGTPGFRDLTLSDIPPVITSVGLTVPTDILSVSNSPLSGYGGTLAISKVPQSDNSFLASPEDGTLGPPVFRKQVFKDFRNLNLTDGQLLGGTTGGDAVATDLLAGSGIVLTKNAGSVTISASLNASNIGTVTNVCITAPGTLFTFSPPCINTSGTFAFVPLVQQANKFFGAPDGASGYPGMRYIATGDLPHLYANQMYLGDPVSGNTSITNLTAGNAIAITTSGGKTTIASTFSVGLDLPTSVFNVTVSTVTNNGTLTGVFKTQTAKTFLAGPVSGAAATPSFRAIGLPDLPALGDGQLYIGNGGTPVATTLSAGPGVTVTPGMGSLTVSINTASVPNMAEAMGEIAAFNTVATTTTIAAVSNGVTNMVEVVCATTLSPGSMHFDMPASGRLRYTGTNTVFCHMATTITIASSGSNQQYVVGMAINGTVQTTTKIMQRTQGSGDTQSTALHGYLQLTTNSYVSLYVGNMVSTSNFQVFSENMFAMCMVVM